MPSRKSPVQPTSSPLGPVDGPRVPAELTEHVYERIWAYLKENRLGAGGDAWTPVALTFVQELAQAKAGKPPTSARGSSPPETATVELTTKDVAERIGCSTRHARTIIRAAGGSKRGRDWQVAERDLIEHMTKRGTN